MAFSINSSYSLITFVSFSRITLTELFSDSSEKYFLSEGSNNAHTFGSSLERLLFVFTSELFGVLSELEGPDVLGYHFR